MSESNLVARRTWFRFFPEGSLEFVVITRVLLVMNLLALAALPGSQRVLALMGLAGLLWLDYTLTLWWLVQMGGDLRALDDAERPASDARRQRVRAAIRVILPATFLVILLAPWPTIIHLTGPVLAAVRIGLGILFLASLAVGCRTCRTLDLGGGRWTPLLLVPVLHWPALHRVLMRLHKTLAEHPARNANKTDAGPGLAVALADLTWIVSALPWLIITGLVIAKGQWPTGATGYLLPTCGTCVAAVFVVIDVAAMENIQRRFVVLFRKGK